MKRPTTMFMVLAIVLLLTLGIGVVIIFYALENPPEFAGDDWTGTAIVATNHAIFQTATAQALITPCAVGTPCR